MIPEELGPKLAGLLSQPGVTDVLVNGCTEVWLQRGGAGMVRIQSPFESEQELAQLAQATIAAGGRHLDQANPFADVAIGAVRFHASLASDCNPATHISIRSHIERQFGLRQLCDFGMFDSQQLQLLQSIVAAKQNFLIAGPTGSGKTTLLRAMLGECANDRIIALEDVAELQLAAGHFVAMQTRQPNVEGKGEITLERLVREALRMRPDRIAVGEVRGVELVTMLQALNTGHSGAGATIHANSLPHVVSRLNLIAHQAGLGRAELAELVSSALDWVLFVDSRCLISIAKFQRARNGLLEVVVHE
ncbi:ATPase, T2SS/T4P/T4SS family [Rhodoluna sp.]|uniref:CpaF family protein n=1 Tax=Rhodoluna sp. TaxID=1969481 RepID=UPI0025FDC7A2|nr:ATPase, T2SS/T4P/T4SS family [Rhodoluna sp.]